MEMSDVIRYYIRLLNIHFILWTLSECAAPVINNVVKTASLLESTTVETLVFTLDVTDADGDTIVCDFGPGGNLGNRFTVKYISGSTTWGIYSAAGSVFDSNSQPTYNLGVKCDANGESDTETFTVSITANQAPVINNLPITGSITIPVATSGIGHNVFSVAATDTESDQISFSITCSPVTPACPFEIFSSGDIVVNTDISGIAIAGYDITVDVSDPYGNNGISKSLTVVFSGINNPPSISNLGSTFTMPENGALNAAIVTTTCTDADAGDTLGYSMTCTPSSGLTYFQIDSSTGAISTTGSSLNYEYIDNAGDTLFACTVTCSDGDASDTASISFDVTNVNEPPKFAQNGYTISADEGASGTDLQASGYVIIDDDNSDTTLFSIDCGTPNTGYFSIDTGSGVLKYGSTYDVDDGVHPTSVSCIVTVTDSGGLTDTVSLDITINNINDNLPIFSPTTYQWFVSEGATVGTSVGKVTATDADVGTLGDISYSLDQSALGTAYFSIDQTGTVYVQNSVAPLGGGASITFDVVATDGGGNETRVTPSVNTVATSTTTTTTTTDRFKTFFEDERNIAWLTACFIIVLITLILITWMCCKYFAESYAKRPTGKQFNFKCCKFWRVTDPPARIREPVPEPEVVTFEEPPVIINKPKPEPEPFEFWTSSAKQ
ncbi:protocadherin Fat 3-like [Ruditapes philippinarum]|uniref:protocadherin Fat 3-like n=1 Tax=Ruditapes philippinarum TaxID=129788 RepID=UPI00295B5B60|nr:protocadherin Fat 3-like [Ruditapes philippinarum]